MGLGNRERKRRVEEKIKRRGRGERRKELRKGRKGELSSKREDLSALVTAPPPEWPALVSLLVSPGQ